MIVIVLASMDFILTRSRTSTFERVILVIENCVHTLRAHISLFYASMLERQCHSCTDDSRADPLAPRFAIGFD